MIALAVTLFARSACAQGFDHAHKTWDELLKKHVVLLEGGKASQLRYAGMMQERAPLTTYLESLSKVAELKIYQLKPHALEDSILSGKSILQMPNLV